MNLQVGQKDGCNFEQDSVLDKVVVLCYVDVSRTDARREWKKEADLK